jgi:hypothetical protein
MRVSIFLTTSRLENCLPDEMLKICPSTWLRVAARRQARATSST